MRFLYAVAFVAALLSAAGCGRTWPTVVGVADPTFLSQGGVRTVAILPVTVDVGVKPGATDSADGVAASFEVSARACLADALAERGYAVVELGLEDQPPDAVIGLSGAAYVGDDGPSAGEVIGIILAVVVIVGLVVAIVAVAKGHGGKSHGGGGHGASGGHGGGIALPSAGGGGTRGARWHARGGGVVGTGGARWHDRGGGSSFRTGWHDHDGHPVSVELDFPVTDPTSYEAEGAPSSSNLDLRLLDARTGQQLWRAHAVLPANPGDRADIRKAIRRLVESLPPAR